MTKCVQNGTSRHESFPTSDPLSGPNLKMRKKSKAGRNETSKAWQQELEKKVCECVKVSEREKRKSQLDGISERLVIREKREVASMLCDEFRTPG